MGHRVFLSHAKEDQEVTSRVCALLQAEGIDCWLASRDAAARKDKAAASLAAIRDSGLVLLIFSASANASSGVLRDIERAIAYERPVLSLHLDDAVPNPSLEYYLNLWQWLDASGGIEDKRDAIVAAVQEHLERTAASAAWRWLDAPDGVDSKREEIVAAARAHLARASTSGSTDKKAAAWWRWGRRAWWIAAGAAAVVALGLGLGLGLGLAGSAGDQGTWTRLSPAGTLPPARAGDLMVCDPSSDRLLVFGGGGVQKGLNDMWAYDPVANTWTELKPSGMVPPGRCDYAMACDPVTQRLILFGGFDGPSSYVNGESVSDDPASDTWAYDTASNSWTELKPTGTQPPARYSAVMAYDPNTKRLILFGGCEDVENGPMLNDTWAYDPAANTWTELKPTGTLPSLRGNNPLVYDPSTRRLILFGGYGYPDRSLNDTWAYDPAANTWTELGPSGRLPPGRSGHAMVYDPSTRRMIVFGGNTAPGSKWFNDTWAYDPSANYWTELKPSGTIPGGRTFPSRAYALSTGQLVVFGGMSVDGQLNDTWAFTY